MKFALCGGLDAPDWVLAELSTLSRIVRTFFYYLYSAPAASEIAAHVVKELTGCASPYEAVAASVRSSSGGAEADTDVEACIAVVHYILVQAAKHRIDDVTLERELQQWGLPAEHSEAVCACFSSGRAAIDAHLMASFCALPPVRVTGWQVQAGAEPCVVLNLRRGQQDAHLVRMAPHKLQLLVHELKAARKMMEDVS